MCAPMSEFHSLSVCMCMCRSEENLWDFGGFVLFSLHHVCSGIEARSWGLMAITFYPLAHLTGLLIFLFFLRQAL